MGQRQIGDRGHPVDGTNTIRSATGQFFVGFARQKDRVVQFHSGRRYPTNHTDRTANGVHPFIECGEYLGIPAVDDFVVDRQHGDCLCPVPVILVKLDILAQQHRAVAIDHSASHRRYRTGGRKDCAFVRDRLDRHNRAIHLDVVQTRAAFSDTLIIRGLNARTQCGGKRGEAIVRRDGLAVYRTDKGHRPAFANRRNARKFNFQHVVEIEIRNNAGHDGAACVRCDRCLNEEARRCQTAVTGDGDRVLCQYSVVARQPIDRNDQAIPDARQSIAGDHGIGRGQEPGLIVDIVV